MRKTLERFYRLMSGHFGPTGWWPGGSAFEIAVGAVLVQNTAWRNVEKAIATLKRRRLLSPKAILAAPVSELEEALVPAGYFRVKTARLRSFCEFLVSRYGGSMARLARTPLPELRRELLAVHGIGHETADDIILYACHQPVFVVDAYTRRILARHGLTDPDIGYEALRKYFERRLPPDVPLYQEYHGLLVMTGNRYCRRKPRCEECPLRETLKRGQPVLE